MAIQDGSCETAGLESSSSKAVTAGPSFASSCGAGVRGSQESCEGPSQGLSVRYDMASCLIVASGVAVVVAGRAGLMNE